MSEDYRKQNVNNASSGTDQVDTTYVLLERAKAGNREALDSLFARHISRC